jgi:hypothetical protein
MRGALLSLVALLCVGACGGGVPPKEARTTARERDLAITVVVPDGFSLRAPLVVSVAGVMPFENRGIASRVVVPSPRVTQPKGEASLALSPLRVPRPAWIMIHADLDENGAVSDKDALVTLAGPLDVDAARFVLDPFRVDVVCIRDDEATRVERANVTAFEVATGRLIKDVAVAIEAPNGAFGLPLGEPPHPPCPEGAYRARLRDPRLGGFAGERAVELAYPGGEPVVKVVQTPTQCRQSSAHVKTASRTGGPSAVATASVDCAMLDWKPLSNENCALFGVRSPRASLLEVGITTPLTGARRPAVAGSLLFERPGSYELELYFGRATLGEAGGALGLVRHVERVE